MDVIRFYRANEKPYGVFSNLCKREMRFDYLYFYTAEHAYQYGKPRRDAVREWLLAAPEPWLLAMAAHALPPRAVVPGWSKTKVDRMRRVVMEKFRQHDDLREILLGTGDARIAETCRTNDAVSRFWGEVENASGIYVGQNWLGRILMETREKLRAEAGE